MHLSALFVKEALTLPKVENGENFCQIWTLFRRGFPPPPEKADVSRHASTALPLACPEAAGLWELCHIPCAGVFGCTWSWDIAQAPFFAVIPYDPFPGGQKMHQPLHLCWNTASRFSWSGCRALHPRLSESPSTMLVHLRCSMNACPMSAPSKEWMCLAPSQPNSSGRHWRFL